MANTQGTAKATGKKLSTGGRTGGVPEDSAAATGLAEMRRQATRTPKLVEGAFVPVTPITYLPDGTKAGCRADCIKEHEHIEPGRKTEHPTVIDTATGVERPNVLTDLSAADIESFLATEAIRPHAE